MEFEEIKNITQNILSERNYVLNNVEISILREELEGKNHTEIARIYGISDNYVKTASANLWRLLSEIVGKKVTSNNFYPVIISSFGK